MERELLMTGIGGQGVQLASQVLARAAMAEGREVQIFGSYGGMMRGGNTDATLVVADQPVEAPPTVASAWSAILMHHDYAAPVVAKLVPGSSVVLVNTTIYDGDLDPALRVVDVPGTAIAMDLGSPVAASMVMIGAYAATTNLVALDTLTAVVGGALPAYRSRHAALNFEALSAGFGAVPFGTAPAWPAVTV